MKIELIALLQDNYAYLLTAEDGTVAIVDPAESAPVENIIDERGGRLDFILNTHHHGDHVGGNEALKNKYEATIIGPSADAHRIPAMDKGVTEGDTFSIGGSEARVFETPGHTSGHISIWFEKDNALFCGDTLFSMGCGRLFEGSPEQMWDSLKKIMALPDETQIYCGHEYTMANGKFCLGVEPDNNSLKKRMDEVETLRAAGKPTIPSTLKTEKETNAFLRAGSAERFAEIRRLKDAA